METFPPITVEAMIEVDRLMVEDYGVALLQMMENAGRSLAQVARRYLGGSAAQRKVVALVGKGNNGGGGLVAARHLANAGAKVTVALAEDPDLLGDVAGHQRRTLERMSVPGADRRTPPEQLPRLVDEADLILDALIGYRLRGSPREPIASFIRAANLAPPPRIALDIPSGLDGNRGTIGDPTIRADATVTLAWPKAGLLVEAARPCVGDLYLADISVPAGVYQAIGADSGSLFARETVVRIYPVAGGWGVAT
jgi:NAD(P)H-hydrate epimerase